MDQTSVAFIKRTQSWTSLLFCLPKIIAYFGNSEFSFQSLCLFMEYRPDFQFKIRLMAQQHGCQPFEELIHLLFESVSYPELFIHTIFEWVKSKGMLNSWVSYIILEKGMPKMFTEYIDLYIYAGQATTSTTNIPQVEASRDKEQ